MNSKPPKLFQYLFPTIANILWIITFFRVLYVGHNMMNADGDLGMHLTIGQYILSTGKIPPTDLFSHTMTGQPVVQHEWLSTVLLALIHRVFSFEGIILYCAIIIATAFGVVYRRVYKATQNYLIVAFVVFFSIMTSMVHWLARPHTITFLFLAIWMFELYQMRKGIFKSWWILPATMLLWVNMHGGFIAGIFTWVVYGVGIGWDVLFGRYKQDERLPKQFLKYFLLSGISSLLVTFINPSGIGLWVKVVSHVGNKYLADHTLEFSSPNFHWVSVWPFLLYIALLIVVLAFNKKKISSPLLFCSVAWLAMSLYGARNVPLFAIVSAPLLGQGLDGLFNDLTTRYKFMTRVNNLNNRLKTIDVHLKGAFWPILSVVLVVTGFAIGIDFFPKQQDYSFDPEVFPVEAVNWLEENPQEGEMFNYFPWGGYLQYRLWPEKKVFIDGKSDFYGEDFVRQYGQVISIEEDWVDILDQYQVEWAILPTDEVLAKMLKAELGWETIYTDDTAVILRPAN